jgi:hypothetical protein
MSNQAARKTYKIELVMTVTADEVGEEHLCANDPEALRHLQTLQQALLKNEPALLRHLLAAVFVKMQEYSDDLTGQDDLTSLMEAADELEPEDRDFFKKSPAALTRPLRTSTLSVSLEKSSISEKAPGDEAEDEWRSVWSDLRPESELARWMAEPTSNRPKGFEDSHYLLTRYLTRQFDDIRLEACCSCEAPVTGVGQDEIAAIEALWKAYNRHRETRDPGSRLLQSWKRGGIRFY